MSDKLQVFAKNRVEMMEAQSHSVAWALNKLEETRIALAEAETNLDQARTHKWKITGWQNVAKREKKKVEYYEKIHAALVAGYVIVPNFPVDLFAIRTKRNYPVKHYSSSWSEDRVQRSEVLALGSGDHRDSVPKQLQHTMPMGEGETQNYYWASEFNDVDFPVKGVKPIILEETSKALLAKIFDEVGCNPGRKGWRAGSDLGQRTDPMVIGRIIYRQRGSYGVRQDKIVSFLITWWLDFEDITV